MGLSTGTKLGTYEVVALLGKGGMGEVWKAHDPQLARDVAIKVSAQQFSDRFEREARAIAALNHPNVCTLYHIGPNYLVMELIEGPTLADRIEQGPIPLEEALGLAKQIALALEAAHEKSIVHRDLKPANIKIRPDGSVKVLDFGLAKRVEEVEFGPDSPTMLSNVGMILGTAGYMAPEQARGKKDVDKRADIWAFGVVLYEMLTGKRLFHGEDTSDILASIIKEEPSLDDAPAQVLPLLKRCLEKDPKKRLRDIGDWELLLVASEPSATAPSRSRLGKAGWIAAGVFALSTAGVSFLYFRQKPPETPILRSSIEPPEKTSFTPTPPALSPDGRKLVFSATSADGKSQLWVRSLDSLTAQPLAGTDDGQAPFWSPDSKSVGFFTSTKLMRAEVAGGPVLILANAPAARGGTWNADGVIVFASSTGQPLRRVLASGGAVSTVTKLDLSTENSQRWPWFLPDGRHFLFLGVIGGSGHGSIRAGSLDSPEIQTLTEADSGAVYTQGRLLFLRGSTLVVQPFDAKTLKLTGEAAPVAEQVQSSILYAAFSVSTTGELVYAGGAAAASYQLTWFDRSGKRIGILGEPGDITRPFFSPDRKSLTVSITDPSSHNSDIWIYDVARGLRSRFTFDPAAEFDGVWSPDGGAIIFDSTRKGSGDLVVGQFEKCHS